MVTYSIPLARPSGTRVLRLRSAAARLLRLWVRFPPEAWMFVCCECCVLSGRGLCDELINRPEESYIIWCVVVYDLETSLMRRSWTDGGFYAKNKHTNELNPLVTSCLKSCKRPAKEPNAVRLLNFETDVTWWMKQERQWTYDITLWQVRVTTGDVGIQYKLPLFFELHTSSQATIKKSTQVSMQNTQYLYSNLIFVFPCIIIYGFY